MIRLRIRNVTDGVEVHESRAVGCGQVATLCGLGPLDVVEWAFTDDEVTCEECKQ